MYNVYTIFECGTYTYVNNKYWRVCAYVHYIYIYIYLYIGTSHMGIYIYTYGL